MEKNQELYYDEIESLRRFKSKIDTHAIYKEDLDGFCDEYEELVAQAKVITRVSDRLQKKLDNANIQIREQNDEIKDKNVQLADTVDQLAKAKVGRRASTILFTVAVVLFILEQLLLEPIIEKYFETQYISLGILGLLFIIVKFSEGAMETFFMNREKRKILAQENKDQ
ncbi:MAG: hypothetical protein HRT61_20830 [Ekhidna sp.]|nr:hypothetical protein [Ekhidna sp.]